VRIYLGNDGNGEHTMEILLVTLFNPAFFDVLADLGRDEVLDVRGLRRLVIVELGRWQRIICERKA